VFNTSFERIHHPFRGSVYIGKALCLWLLFGLLTAANAQEFECSIPGDKRYLRLDIPGEEHLCEVSVTQNETPRQVMWYANNESLFCSAKIYDLRDKYENSWGYDCTEWLDTNGVDKLSERHRTILDGELKALINDGQSATPSFQVTGVKAAASNPLNLAPGNLAIQYFLQEEGAEITQDITQVIFDNGESWRSIAELDSLTSYVDFRNKEDVKSALLHGISETGVLHVNTTVIAPSESTTATLCQGEQMLLVSEDSLLPKSPHRILCIN